MRTFKDRVTIYEVAKSAGVSLATVSRVINNKNNVTEKTRKLVEDTIERLGYKPSALAQGLATNRSTNIGIVLPATNYVYISNILSGMVDIAKIYGYQTTLFITRKSKDDAQKVIEKLITSHVDGAVIFDDELDSKEIEMMQKYNLPLVVIGHEMAGEKLGSITLDYETTLLSILENYYDKGGDDVKFLDVANAGNMMDNLRDSVSKYADEHGKHVQLIHCDDSYQRLYADMKVYFETHKSGFFIAPRDSLACAVINAATDCGLNIPNDIEVISVVGTKYSYIVRPQVSSLEIDMFEVGSIAMRMLTKLLKKNLDKMIFRFKSTFAIRGSTKK